MFVIASLGYTPKHGGIVALHSLCHRLNTLGFEAKLYPLDGSFVSKPGWHTPWANLKDLRNAIVVYPEIVTDNPFNADRVVRWLLNRPGYINGQPIHFANTDLVYTHTRVIAEEYPILHVPTIDPLVFYPKDKPGRGSLFYRGKGTASDAFMPAEPEIEITQDWPSTKLGLATLFREASWLYSLDTLSAVNIEARLCGTPVWLFPDRLWSRADVERCETGTAGLGWVGEDDPFVVRKSVVDAYPEYLDFLASVDEKIGLWAEKVLTLL